MNRTRAHVGPAPAPGLDPGSTGQDGWDSNSFAQDQLLGGPTATTLPFLAAADPASQQGERIARARDTTARLGTLILDATTKLIPAYLLARDAIDTDAVAEIGGALLGAVGTVRGGRAALGELLAGIPRKSLVGTDAATDVDRATELKAIEGQIPALDAFAARLESEVIDTFVPHTFQGAEVAPAAIALPPAPAPIPALGRELQRTFGMLETVRQLRTKVAAPVALTPAQIADCRRLLEPWAARPLDLAFLKAALGPVWTILDHEAERKDRFQLSGGYMPASRPSDLMAQASERVKTTGWLGDTGTFDIDTMHILVMGDDKEGALFGLRHLYSADATSRAKLLEQMALRGDLDPFCEKLGREAVQTLHDELPNGYGELKTKLQKYFLDDGSWEDYERKPGDSTGADLGMLPVLLADTDKQTAEFALDELFNMDADRRSRALVALQQRGMLDPMLGKLGWRPIKELHDSLAQGYSELKTQLQGYFLDTDTGFFGTDKDKFGPSLDSEWESHESSLYSLVNRVPYAGKPLNIALDVATFGFNSSYGQARDAHSRGDISDSEYASTRNHVFVRTAAMAAVSMLTGGAADKFLRGAGTGATLAGVGGGMVGGAAGHATSDAYNVYVSGEQKSFSSLEDYTKAVFLGGVMGGVLGRASEALSARSARYAKSPSGAANELAGAPRQQGSTGNELAPPTQRQLGPEAPETVAPAEVAPTEIVTPTRAPAEAPGAATDPHVAEAMRTYDALGETPGRIDMRAHDQAFAGDGAHTTGRHDPSIPLERAPGQQTIEGRIHGDAPWNGETNWSYRWRDEVTMNETVNNHIRNNWESIRSELALEGRYQANPDAGHAIGEGYFNPGQMGVGPRASVYSVTSRFRITILLRPGNPPTWFVLTAFPAPVG